MSYLQKFNCCFEMHLHHLLLLGKQKLWRDSNPAAMEDTPLYSSLTGANAVPWLGSAAESRFIENDKDCNLVGYQLGNCI